MYTTYRVFIYDIMKWCHYYEEINNECWPLERIESNNQIFSCDSFRKCWNLSQIVCSMLEWNAGVMRCGLIIVCQKANGDQCDESTCPPSPKKFICSQGYGLCFLGQTRSYSARGHNVNADLQYVIVWSITTSSLQKAMRSGHSSTWQWFSPHSAPVRQ